MASLQDILQLALMCFVGMCFVGAWIFLYQTTAGNELFTILGYPVWVVVVVGQSLAIGIGSYPEVVRRWNRVTVSAMVHASRQWL